VLDQLFPGLEGELVATGAVPIDFPGDALWLSPAGWSQRFRPGLRLVSCSRPLLEWTVRRRLAASTTVGFLEGQEATGLTADDHKTAVTGVRLRTRPHPSAAVAPDSTLPAALVIDASGRRARNGQQGNHPPSAQLDLNRPPAAAEGLASTAGFRPNSSAALAAVSGG
jgi:hypothetical protein